MNEDRKLFEALVDKIDQTSPSELTPDHRDFRLVKNYSLTILHGNEEFNVKFGRSVLERGESPLHMGVYDSSGEILTVFSDSTQVDLERLFSRTHERYLSWRGEALVRFREALDVQY